MTQPTDVREQALAYVRHQAAKSLSDLAALIERTTADCDRCLEGISDEQAAFKPALDEWCTTEVLQHLTSSLERVNDTVRRLATGEAVDWQPQEGGLGYEGASFAEMKERLAQVWQGCLVLIKSLPVSGNEGVQVDHPFFGPLNWREWIAFQRLHAIDHVQQIEKVKAEPAYPRR